MEKGNKETGQTALRIYTVSLEGMEFVAFHGCREDEKINGNIFSVDFKGTFESGCAGNDALEDTLNYGKIYDIIAGVMRGERCNLLETLASRIMDAVSREFPTFIDFEVCVGKKNPPVAGTCSWSRISCNLRLNG